MSKIFKNNPNLKHYFKTSDGMAFFHEHHANTHAKTLEDRDVEKVKRPKDKKSASKDQDKSQNGNKNNGTQETAAQAAKRRKEAIVKLETVEEVEKALEGETAKSVINAGNARIEEIKNKA